MTNFTNEHSDYKRGTILQRVYDPLQGSFNDENGTVVVDIAPEELDLFHLDNEEILRKEYDLINADETLFGENVEEGKKMRIEEKFRLITEL